MKSLRMRLLKSVMAFTLIFAMAVGLAAGFKGKAKAGAPGTYTVTINGNGGTILYGGSWKKTHTLTWGSGAYFGLPGNMKEKRNGYFFVGFCKNANGTGYIYSPGEVTTIGGNTTFYAIWKKVTVSYYNSSTEGYFKYDDGTTMTDGNGYALKQIWLYNQGGWDTPLKSNRVVIKANKKILNFNGWFYSYPTNNCNHIYKNEYLQQIWEAKGRPSTLYFCTVVY